MEAQPTAHVPSPAATDPCVPEDLGDPDVTGFGVLISFMFSVLLVVVAIVWAYITDALPRKCYNEFDNFILGRKNRNGDGERVRSFQSFILAMSDQQLVSGLALVVAINVIRNGVHDLDKKIAAYSYANAVILAFFSCIIHLATIAVLRDYLRNRGLLKHVRVAIMICVLALLLQSLGETWTMDTTVTLRCAIEYRQFLGDDSGTDALTERLGNADTVLGLVILLGILGSGYVRRILELYLQGSQDFPMAWQITLFAKTIGWPTSSQTDLLVVKERLALESSSLTLNTGRRIQLLFLVIPGSFARSFMFEILWLIFYLVFGLAQEIFFLRSLDSGVLAISFEPRFGQLLPLVLLVLPFLAMAEGYSGENRYQSLLALVLITGLLRGSEKHESQDNRQERSISQLSGPRAVSAPESHAAATEEKGPNDGHKNKLDESELESEENDKYSAFLISCKRHGTFMKVWSWIFVVLYLLICLYISLAVGELFVNQIGWGWSALMTVVAFILSGLSVLISLAVRLTQLWKFRKELQSLQRGTGAA